MWSPKEISVGTVGFDSRPGRTKPYQARPNDPVSGKRLRSQTFSTEEDANRWLVKRRAELVAEYAGAGVPVAPSSVTFAEQVAVYLAHYCTHPEGSGARRTAIHHTARLCQTFGDRPVARIERGECKRYAVAISRDPSSRTGRPLSTGTQCDRMRYLDAVLESAVDEGVRRDNPAAGLRALERRRIRSTAKHRFTDTEVARLVAKLPDWARPVVLLGRHAGLRVGEIVGLCWEQVDLEPNGYGMGRIIIDRQYDSKSKTLGPPKGRVTRTLPLLPDAMGALRRLDAGTGTDRVLVHPTRVMNDHTVRETFNEAVRAAGIVAGLHETPSPHGLRSSFNEAMRAADFPEWVRKAAMRHAPTGSLGFYESAPEADLLDPWFAKLVG